MAESTATTDWSPAETAELDELSHDPPMVEPVQCEDEDELRRWFEGFSGAAVVRPLMVGAALSLRYDSEGRLALACDRGNGAVGAAVTDTARRIAGVPDVIDTYDIEVRGDVYTPRPLFEERLAGEYEAPDRAAADLLGSESATDELIGELRFCARDVFGVTFDSEADKLTWLDELGFRTPPWRRLDDLQSPRLDEREGLAPADYPTHGVVLRANRIDEQRRLGRTAERAAYEIAYASPTGARAKAPTPIERNDGDDAPAPQRARLEQLERFADQMEIDGLGPGLLARMYDRGIIEQPADLYDVTVADLLDVDGVGRTRAQSLVEAIDRRRSVRPETFLAALGIDQLGRHAARRLVERFEDLDAVLNADAERLVEVPAIGPVIARKVVEGVEQHAEVIAALRDRIELTATELDEAESEH